MEAALQAEHGAQRKMMGGRHDGETRLGRRFLRGLERKARLVDAHRHGAHRGGGQGIAAIFENA